MSADAVEQIRCTPSGWWSLVRQSRTSCVCVQRATGVLVTV